MLKRFFSAVPFMVLISSGLFLHYDVATRGQLVNRVGIRGGTASSSFVVTEDEGVSPAGGTIALTGFEGYRLYQITLIGVTQTGKEYFRISSPSTRVGAIISNTLAPGTVVYRIRGVSPVEAVAVPWQGGYLKAVNVPVRTLGTISVYSKNATHKQGYYEVQNIPVPNIGQHYGDVNVIGEGYIEFVSRTLPGGTALYSVPDSNPERTLAVKIHGKYFRAVWVNDF
ncbi:hypothetical protein [Alicyclobacillus ferrooxydans]|uniref:Uncharacterized protein n=1 Tax=Alicyclobacillus ferrooxydans TaxID=471514 RepID=A0A0P9CIP3_9BACL|nr:hypothetical protein [Alicyclobacillus ferrooxydans]KPV42889.1 hypothetical protein AN477_15250 [Alicyclobacillus ferrooxydans]